MLRVNAWCPQIYRMGKGVHIQDGKVIRNNASTNYDTSQKTITPMVIPSFCDKILMKQTGDQLSYGNASKAFYEAHIDSVSTTNHNTL